MRFKKIYLSDMTTPPSQRVRPPEVVRLPVYSADLIAELDATIPHRCIGADESYTAHQRYAGQRELIDALLRRLQAANVLAEPTTPCAS